MDLLEELKTEGLLYDKKKSKEMTSCEELNVNWENLIWIFSAIKDPRFYHAGTFGSSMKVWAQKTFWVNNRRLTLKEMAIICAQPWCSILLLIRILIQSILFLAILTIITIFLTPCACIVGFLGWIFCQPDCAVGSFAVAVGIPVLLTFGFIVVIINLIVICPVMLTGPLTFVPVIAIMSCTFKRLPSL